MTEQLFSFVLISAPGTPLTSGHDPLPVPATIRLLDLPAIAADLPDIVFIGRTVLGHLPCFTALLQNPVPAEAGTRYDVAGDAAARALPAMIQQLRDRALVAIGVEGRACSVRPHAFVSDTAENVPPAATTRITEWALARHTGRAGGLACVYGEQLPPCPERVPALSPVRPFGGAT